MKNLYAPLFIASLLLFSCSSNNSKKSNKSIDAEVNMEETIKQKSAKKIFLNLPSPIELTQTLLSTKSDFDNNLLNPVKNIDRYNSSSKLALNFGIYGADLCYCRVYEQLQESISYLSVIRKITDKLQIPEEEGAETINRIEQSIENRDSIFQIIADTYASADGYLKENEREMTAAFILVGGWVEGMHFALSINNNKDEGIVNRIAEQKFPLENIMKLINGYADESSIKDIYPLFVKLSEVYSKVEISYSETVVITDNESNETTIDNSSKINIQASQLKEINNLISEIRSIIVS